MGIHQPAAFDYEAEFTEQSFRASEVVLQGADRGGGDLDCLVGPRPTLGFWNDLLVIFTSESRQARVRHASFPVGDAVGRAGRPGDRLNVSRDGAGDIGLSVLRGRELILAFGAVTAVPLGGTLRVDQGTDGRRERPSADRWLELSAGGERLLLRGQEFSRVGGYHVYVERCREFGIPGKSECAAVCAVGDEALRIAAIRAAVLLGNGALKTVGWDNTEHVTALRRWV